MNTQTMNKKLFSVNEIFSSIEGEGVRAGFLATFIRFNGCNLRCGYCDTTYALRPKENNMSLKEIMAKVKYFGHKRITITGGEPLFQPFIEDLINSLVFANYEINIETNGSIPFNASCANCILTMDWKCPSSNMNKFMCNDNLFLLREQDVLKFVVSTDEDLQELLRIYKLNLPCAYYISPVFGKITPAKIVEFMKENKLENATVQVQLHKIIYDPSERGV